MNPAETSALTADAASVGIEYGGLKAVLFPAVFPVVLVKILPTAVTAVNPVIKSIGVFTFSNTLFSTRMFASKPAATHLLLTQLRKVL